MAIIKTSEGICFLVDDDILDTLICYTWRVVNREKPYGITLIDGKRVLMHRLILSELNDTDFVDHINGNRLDNRKCNLRVCTKSQNAMNRGAASHNKCGFKGVYKDSETGKYRCEIKSLGQRIRPGSFNTAEEAARVYNFHAKIIHGEFAKYNDVSPLFPDNYDPSGVLCLRNTSGYRGIVWSKQTISWQARIYHGKKHLYLGCFDNKIDAAIAYDRKAIEIHGDKAKLNFPENALQV
jgi:hypothetical protein